MPIVARATPQVEQAALPGVRRQAVENEASAGVLLEEQRARTDQAMAQTGSAVAQLGILGTREAREMADKAKERADQIAALQANNQLAMKSNELTVNALHVKGKDAFGLPESVQAEYNKFADEVGAGMVTDKQKLAFEHARLTHAQNLDLTLRRHVAQQQDVYEGQELTASLENGKSAAIAASDDPTRVGLELNGMVAAIKVHGKNLGMGPEEIQASIDKTTSGVHVGVIENLLANDKARSAKIYFDEAKGQIKGEALAHIEKALEEGGLRSDSQKIVDDLMKKTDKDGNPLPITQLEDLARTAAGDNAKLRDEVNVRLEHQHAVRKAEIQEQHQDQLKVVYDILDKTADHTKIPPSVWANMSGSDRSAALAYETRLTKGEAETNDDPTYYSLMMQAAYDPTTFRNQPLLSYRSKLTRGSFDQLVGMQAAIVKGDIKQAEAAGAGAFRTHNEILTDSLSQYGIDTKDLAKKSKTDPGNIMVAQLRRKLDDAVANQERATGKKPTATDIQAHVDRLLSAQTTVKGSWFGLIPFNGVPFNDQHKAIISTTIGDVSAADKAAITNKLRALGRTVSDATILDTYIEGMLRTVKP